jgi:hypothetical protein
LRTSEGRNGTLSALILPHGEKTAVSIEIPIKALNLHTRSDVRDSTLDSLPISQFGLSGDFDIEDSLQWLNECLPDVPLATQDTELKLGYKSSFLGTLMQVQTMNGEILVKTDNLSVLAIMKDQLT